MTIEELRDRGYEDVVVFETPDFDGAIIGVFTDDRAIYSLNKMVRWLMDKDGIDEDEALEFIEYNTLRALPFVMDDFLIQEDE